MKSFLELQQASNRTGIRFLMIEAEMALSCLDSAEESTVPSHRRQSIDDAQKAYDSIVYFLPRLALSVSEQTKMDASLHRIADRLKKLGISLPAPAE